MNANDRIQYGPRACIRSFVHYTTPLLALCGRTWRFWTSKMLVMYIRWSVCPRLSQFAHLSSMQYMGLKNALVVTFRVDFNLANYQISSSPRKQHIDETSICRGTFMTCDHHGFAASNRVTWVCVEYFLSCKLSWCQDAGYSKPDHKAV